MKLELQIKDNKIFIPLKQKWFKWTPEEDVRQKYIIRLVNDYGYSLKQMEQEILVSSTKRGTGGARADIIIYKNEEDKNNRKNAFIVVECKADNIKIQKEDYFQGANYASMAHADFVVTTNLKETKIFKLVKKQIPHCLNFLDEIIDIPKADVINDSKKIEAFLKQTKAFTRNEFSKLLFTCHNIIRNNDKLSPEAAFDEISKILFIKIRYELNNSNAQIFSKKQFLKLKKAYSETQSKTSLPFYQQLFERTKEDFIDDALFDKNETIKIKEISFEAIVKKLESYNLSTTTEDVKGIAFEQFLGKTFRGELGQFFTPRTIVDFMVEVLDPQEGEIICDPCCGSGGFLIKAFEYVKAKIEKEIHEQKQQIKQKYSTDNFDKLTKKQKEEIDEKVNDLFNELNLELDIRNEKSRLYRFSYDCIFGTDANIRMSKTAKMNLIMHGNGHGHGGVYHNDGLLNINGIFENRFDIIITNPPFGTRVEKTTKITETDKSINPIDKYKKRYGQAYINSLNQVNNNIGKNLLSLYKTSSITNLTEVLFLERCLILLKPGGRMGIVLPEGVFNNYSLQKIRDFVESQAKIILITSIPQDVFIASGATIKTSLLFLKKFTEKEAKEWHYLSKKAKHEIEKKYSLSLIDLYVKLFLRGKEAPQTVEKKKLRKKIKQIEQKIETEIKAQIKNKFNYQIAIAAIEQAGIGTGAKNELIQLCKDFTRYKKEHKLWNTKFNSIDYKLDNRESEEQFL
uniref:Uncharacterized protein n=1 Tax=Pseudochlorodesmis sp. HV01306a TaxID=2358488 RepID=A0A386AY45_9CHLO|nr:hypothetical protein [Pseudochlorodesmis sp. HV01306a]